MTKNNFAPPLLRVLAGIVDWLIFVVITLAFLVLIAQSPSYYTLFNNAFAALVVGGLLIPILLSLFNSYMISKLGGTVGKLATHTRIVDKEGNLISFKRAFFRNHIGYLVSGIFLWLGFYWVFRDPKRQGWHDMMAGTFVVAEKTDKLLYGLILIAILLFITASQLILILETLQNSQSIINQLIEELFTAISSLV